MSDANVKLLHVKPLEVRRAIEQSMSSGAARVLHSSCVLDPDPIKHGCMLAVEAVKAQRGDDRAWEVVVNSMSRLVFHVAQRYFWKWSSHLPAHASFDDVFMAGMEGLTIGVNKFDAGRGYVLTTSATYWIRTKVQRACYAQCGSARIPEHLLQAGLDPNDPLVASSAMSLDWRQSEDDPALHESLQTLDPASQVDTQLLEIEGLRRVVELLRAVDERLPEVAELLERGYADREIARLTGLTSKRVEELRGKAAATLRAAGF